MAESYSKEIKELVKLRLMATPSNIKISMGSLGEFSKDQLIKEVEDGSVVGNAAIRMELIFMRKMASLSKRASEGE